MITVVAGMAAIGIEPPSAFAQAPSAERVTNKSEARPERPRRQKARRAVPARTTQATGTTPPTAAPPARDPAPPAAPPRRQRAVLVRGGLLDHFYRTLGPFGAWKQDATLGLLWVPDPEEVGDRFLPYVSRGHWEVTETGAWAWASDFDWGHVPFHYGRWEWTEEHGWGWIPGTQWAPAWVVWRLTSSGYDYTAWAPTPASHVYRHDPEVRSSKPDGAFTRRARRGKRALRFTFVFNQYLFDDDVASHVIWDPAVSAWLGARSKIFRKHGSSLRPATPTLEQANVPDYWTPLGRIDSSDERIRPFVVISS